MKKRIQTKEALRRGVKIVVLGEWKEKMNTDFKTSRNYGN